MGGYELRQVAGDAAMLRCVSGEARQGRDAREGKPPEDFAAFPRRP